MLPLRYKYGNDVFVTDMNYFAFHYSDDFGVVVVSDFPPHEFRTIAAVSDSTVNHGIFGNRFWDVFRIRDIPLDAGGGIEAAGDRVYPISYRFALGPDLALWSLISRFTLRAHRSMSSA